MLMIIHLCMILTELSSIPGTKGQLSATSEVKNLYSPRYPHNYYSNTRIEFLIETEQQQDIITFEVNYVHDYLKKYNMILV